MEGFCYYHYWFGNGKRELELPFDEVLRTGEPDFPFCLCWANESWHSKFWNMDGSIEKKLLIEQTYPGDEDIIQHFQWVLPAIKDPRYIRIDEKPLFMVYRANLYPGVSRFIEIWNKLAKENGFDGFFFTTQISSNVTSEAVDYLRGLGFDAVNTNELWMAANKNNTFFKHMCRKVYRTILRMPNVFNYNLIYQNLITDLERREDVFPTLIPNWDHSPRSGRAGSVLVNTTPKLFGKHVHQAMEVVLSKSESKRVVFLKSWNEWGEGNYVEPDLRFGKDFLESLKREVLA